MRYELTNAAINAGMTESTIKGIESYFMPYITEAETRRRVNETVLYIHAAEKVHALEKRVDRLTDTIDSLNDALLSRRAAAAAGTEAIEVTVNRVKVLVPINEWIQSAMDSLAEAETARDLAAERLAKWDAVVYEADELEEGPLFTLAAVLKSAVLGGKTAAAAFAPTIKAVGAWNADKTPFRVDTRAESYKAMKAALLEAARAFEFAEEGPGYKKARVNLNTGEIEALAAKLSAAKWTPVKVAEGGHKWMTHELAEGESSAAVARDLARMILVKLAGRKLTSTAE